MEERNRWIQDLARKGITDTAVLRALKEVPRHEFVPSELRSMAYEDRPLPIDCGQTISQIFIVALMTSLLQIRPEHTILEVGTGSGYQTAILARLAKQVYTVECFAPLSEQAQERLQRLGYSNISCRIGDGYAGWAEASPFDGIIVTAAVSAISPSWREQLAIHGRMVVPVGDIFTVQTLECWHRLDNGFDKSTHGEVRFVPLLRC